MRVDIIRSSACVNDPFFLFDTKVILCVLYAGIEKKNFTYPNKSGKHGRG